MRYKNKKLVDVCTGKMTLAQLNSEIARYMLQRSPSLLLVTIEQDAELKGYRATIYMTLEDFTKNVKYDAQDYEKWLKKTQLFSGND